MTTRDVRPSGCLLPSLPVPLPDGRLAPIGPLSAPLSAQPKVRAVLTVSLAAFAVPGRCVRPVGADLQLRHDRWQRALASLESP